eukprot:1139316-Pelagomonas_calceolata.AAC.1
MPDGVRDDVRGQCRMKCKHTSPSAEHNWQRQKPRAQGKDVLLFTAAVWYRCCQVTAGKCRCCQVTAGKYRCCQVTAGKVCSKPWDQGKRRSNPSKPGRPHGILLAKREVQEQPCAQLVSREGELDATLKWVLIPAKGYLCMFSSCMFVRLREWDKREKGRGNMHLACPYDPLMLLPGAAATGMPLQCS